jgi:hypothetical protein
VFLNGKNKEMVIVIENGRKRGFQWKGTIVKTDLVTVQGGVKVVNGDKLWSRVIPRKPILTGSGIIGAILQCAQICS